MFPLLTVLGTTGTDLLSIYPCLNLALLAAALHLLTDLFLSSGLSALQQNIFRLGKSLSNVLTRLTEIGFL